MKRNLGAAAILAALLLAGGASAGPSPPAQMRPLSGAVAALRLRLVGRGTLDGRHVTAVQAAGPCRTRVDTAGATPPVMVDWRSVGNVGQTGLVRSHGVGLTDAAGRRLHAFGLASAREADLAEASMSVLFTGCTAH